MADHGWTGSVARITVSVEEAAPVEEAALPAAGAVLPDGSGGIGMGLIILSVIGVAFVALGGAIGLIRRRTVR